MNYDWFILDDDEMLLFGAQALADSMLIGRAITITIKRVSLMELMRIDANYKRSKKRSVAIVPDDMYEVLMIFAGMETIKVVSSKMSLLSYSELINDAILLKDSLKEGDKMRTFFLTAKERRYCYMLYNGVPSKKIALYFQCNNKNISYLKRKIMSRWRCKNKIEFYKIINYFFY